MILKISGHVKRSIVFINFLNLLILVINEGHLIKKVFMYLMFFNIANAYMPYPGSFPGPMPAPAPTPTPKSKLRDGSYFLDDIYDKINEKKNQGMNADDIMRAVREEVRVDEAVVCLQKFQNKIYRLSSRPNSDGAVTDSQELALYNNFFTAAETAINQATSPILNQPNAYTRPKNIVVHTFQLTSVGGKIQNFQANISVLDRDNICFIRFAIPALDQTVKPSEPPKSGNFKEAAEIKVLEMLNKKALFADIQKSIITDIEVQEAIICVERVGDKTFFRLHSRVSNDGFMPNEQEINSYEKFFSSAITDVKNSMPGAPITLDSNVSFPNNLPPSEYNVQTSFGLKNFKMYPFIIDEKHICFGRVVDDTPANSS